MAVQKLTTVVRKALDCPSNDGMVGTINRIIQNFTSKFIFFQWGNQIITGYGIFLSLGFGLGTFCWLYFLERRFNYDLPNWPIILGMVVAAYAGSRVLFEVEQKLADWFNQRAICRGGHTFYGGLVGCLLYSSYLFHENISDLFFYADCAAPGVALGYGVGKFGCLSYGCCVGRPTSGRLAVKYVADFSKAVGYYDLKGIPLAPVQIYESLLGLGLFSLLCMRPDTSFGTGQVMGWFLLLLTVGRFTLIRLRYHLPDDRAGKLISAILTMLQVGLGLALLSKVIFRTFSPEKIVQETAETISILRIIMLSITVTIMALFIFGLRRIKHDH
jgi:phosphatidylglycerol---prolipoprotein diacylglyceryl transferase